MRCKSAAIFSSMYWFALTIFFFLSTGSPIVSQLTRPMIRLAEVDHFLVAFVDRAHHDAVYGSAIVLNDDHILCRIHEFAGEITGVRGFQRRIGKTFARTVGGNEVLQHGESFAEI